MCEGQDILRFTQKFHNKLKRFCDPLVHHFGVNEFNFQKETNTGESKTIHLNQEWINYYYSESIYLLNPLSTHPDNHQEGIILVDDREDKSTKKLLEQAIIKFGIHFSIVLCIKVPNGTEFYSFGLTSSKPLQIMKFYNEMPLIKTFIKLFREQFHREILDLNDYGIDIRKLKGPSYEKLSVDLFPQSVDLFDFLEKIGLKIPGPLTPKEVVVVKHFVRGLSASKIANELSISPRTVEHHLERIKDKLDCMTKAELIQKVQQLDSFGCLISTQRKKMPFTNLEI